MTKTTQTPLACIILAAGAGTRMKSATPKVLHKLAGKSMIRWLIDSVETLSPQDIVVVINPQSEVIGKEVAPHRCAVQAVPQGTGDAVKAGMDALPDFKGNILILLGDMPFIRTDTLQRLIDIRHSDPACALSVLGAKFDTPPAFGRLVLNEKGHLEKIVEDKDCNPEEKLISLCNSGAFAVDADRLREWLPRLDNKNAQGEYYITDLPALAKQDGYITLSHITTDTQQIEGVNSRADLAKAEAQMQNILREKAMTGGATLIDPDSVFFCHDTVIGRDVLIEPHVFFGPGVTIGDHVHIKAFSHLEGANVENDVVIGPFARLRPGTTLREGAKIGNFVEIKNSDIGKGSKANHLGYIGDAQIGEKTNFACGAITANYDGFEKHKTMIGDHVMIGSNVNLIAPVTIADGSYIAAGSTVSKDIPEDALAVSRGQLTVKEGWAARNRERRLKKKAS